MLLQCWPMGQDLAPSTGNTMGSKLQAAGSVWVVGSWEFQSYVPQSGEGAAGREGQSCRMKSIGADTRNTSDAECACGQATSALFWDSLTPRMYMERLERRSLLSCCIHLQQAWLETNTAKLSYGHSHLALGCKSPLPSSVVPHQMSQTNFQKMMLLYSYCSCSTSGFFALCGRVTLSSN